MINLSRVTYFKAVKWMNMIISHVGYIFSNVQ